MPESVIPDKYAEQVPRFSLPKEFTNPPETPSTPPVEKAPAASAPKEPKAETTPKVEAVPEAPEAPEVPEVKSETTEKDQAPPPAKTGEEKRIFRAIRKANEAQARAEAAERRLQELETQRREPQIPSSKPRMEDFTDIGEFEKAVDKWARVEAVKEYETKQREQASRTQSEKLTRDWQEKVDDSDYEDWDEIVGNLKPETPLNIALMHTENGVDIAYHLGKNRKEVDRILGLNPAQQFIEIGKLSVKLSLKAEPPKQPSKAPPPIAPLSVASAVPDDQIKPQQPYEEYQKIGNKLFRGRR